MPGQNWNSKTGEWTDVVGEDTKAKAERAREMLKSGNSIANIAKLLRLSQARVRELLRE